MFNKLEERVIAMEARERKNLFGMTKRAVGLLCKLHGENKITEQELDYVLLGEKEELKLKICNEVK